MNEFIFLTFNEVMALGKASCLHWLQTLSNQSIVQVIYGCWRIWNFILLQKKYNLGPIYTMCFHRSDFIYDLKVRSWVGKINFALLQREPSDKKNQWELLWHLLHNYFFWFILFLCMIWNLISLYMTETHSSPYWKSKTFSWV